MATLLELVVEKIENMSSDELIELNNSYCDSAQYSDDKIFENDDDFLDTYFSSVTKAVRAVYYGNYNYNHKYVKFDGNGNLESMNSFDVSDLPDYIEKIADYVIDNQSDFSMFDWWDLESEVDESNID